MEAAAEGHKQLVNMLLTAKAGRASTKPIDDKGYTALHHAAEKGHASICMVLLFYGAKADARTSHGETALDLAMKHG